LCDVTLQVNGHERTPILGKLDEAWQCTYADLGALGALPAKWSVGDPGQVAPVVTGSTERWEGQASGPHQPAPAALLAAHGEAITVHELTNSWRLGPQTCALVSQHFYPQMPFTSRRPDEAVIAPDGTGATRNRCSPNRSPQRADRSGAADRVGRTGARVDRA
jgi:hypothetical protein